jgi:hypothetical protein
MSGHDGAAKAERLAAALRENLKRRKAQARGRAADRDDRAKPEGKRASTNDAHSEPDGEN